MAKKKSDKTPKRKPPQRKPAQAQKHQQGQAQHQHITVNVDGAGVRTRAKRQYRRRAVIQEAPRQAVLPPPQYNFPVSLDSSQAFHTLFSDLRQSLNTQPTSGSVALATGERKTYSLGQEPVSRIPIFDTKPVDAPKIRLPNDEGVSEPTRPVPEMKRIAPILSPEKPTPHLAEMIEPVAKATPASNVIIETVETPTQTIEEPKNQSPDIVVTGKKIIAKPNALAEMVTPTIPVKPNKMVTPKITGLKMKPPKAEPTRQEFINKYENLYITEMNIPREQALKDLDKLYDVSEGEGSLRNLYRSTSNKLKGLRKRTQNAIAKSVNVPIIDTNTDTAPLYRIARPKPKSNNLMNIAQDEDVGF